MKHFTHRWLLLAFASLLLLGCKREKAEPFVRSSSFETVDSTVYEAPDTSSSTPEERMDTSADLPAEKVPQRSSRYSHGSYDDSESADKSAGKETAKEREERRRRMEEVNRGFDAGIYGEHIHGFDRDNYDPDIDDW